MLKSVAEKLQATGPVVAMSANLKQAHALADVWLTAGRADQVAVMAADVATDGPQVYAAAELWQGRLGSAASSALAITSYTERHHEVEGVSCTALATEVIQSLAPPASQRTALIVGSMLADAGELLFASVSPRDPGPPLERSIRSLANRLGFSEAFVLVGSSGATMTALALAQDLVALDRADRVVVCGVDLVHGALAQALGLLHCGDLLHMLGGAAAVTLEPRVDATAGDHPTLETCSLISPAVPSQPTVPMNLDGVPLSAVDATSPKHVMLSGLNSIDFACAEQLAEQLWPQATISSQGEVRSVAADVLRLAGTAKNQDLPMGIVGVHSLGGTGWCLIS